MKKVLFLIIFILLSTISFSQLNTNYFMYKGRVKLSNKQFNESIEYFNTVINIKPDEYDAYFFRAIAKYNLNDYIGAEYDFTTTLDLKPNHLNAYYYRAMSRINLNKYQLATEDLLKAINLSPIDPDFFVSIGFCRINLKQYDLAIQDFNSALELAKNDKRALFYKGWSHYLNKDTAEALRDFNYLAKFDSIYSLTYLHRGLIYYEKEELDSALSDFNRYINLEPMKADGYVNRSLVWYKKDSTENAVSDLDTAVNIEPGNSLALFNRALMKNNMGNTRAAIADMDEVIRINPQNILTLFNRGQMKLQVDDFEGAFLDFTKAIEIYPNFAKAYTSRALIRERYMDIEGAKEDREKAKEIADRYKSDKSSGINYADTAETFQRLITLKSSNRFYESGKIKNPIQPQKNVNIMIAEKYYLTYEEEVGFNEEIDRVNQEWISDNNLKYTFNLDTLDHDKIIQLSESLYEDIRKPDNTEALFQLAILKAELKNYNEAIKLISDAISNDPDNFLLYYTRGNIRSNMVKYMMLFESQNQIILPSFSKSSENKDLVSDVSYKDYDLVLSDYQKAIRLEPGFVFARYNKANTLLNMKQYQQAVDLYTEVIEQAPGFAHAYYNRGLTYIFLKQNENGCIDMSKAGELGNEKAYEVIRRFCEN